MIEISVYNSSVEKDNNVLPVYHMKTYSKINIITGDSGSGKTLFVDNVLNAINRIDEWYLEATLNVVVINNIENIGITHNSIVIIDEDLSVAILKNNMIGILQKSDNYFIICDRGTIGKLETNVNAVYEMVGTGEVIEGIEIYSINNYFKLNDASNIDSNIANTVKYIITEDTKSGKIFWKTLLNKLIYFESTNTNNVGGKSNIIKTIEELFNENSESIALIGLDYDTGSIEMYRIINSGKIDNTRIIFIRMESFEEVICNSEFILDAFPEMRDKVINYKEYINIRDKHTGNYFSKLLFEYVKQRPPVDSDSKRNVEQFYSKGGSHFEKCFTANCCYYSMDNCKLFTDKEKRKVMLSNKFECLQKFMSNI